MQNKIFMNYYFVSMSYKLDFNRWQNEAVRHGHDHADYSTIIEKIYQSYRLFIYCISINNFESIKIGNGSSTKILHPFLKNLSSLVGWVFRMCLEPYHTCPDLTLISSQTCRIFTRNQTLTVRWLHLGHLLRWIG